MSREDYEQSMSYALAQDLPKPAGHPDVHGHYPGDPDEQYCSMCNPANVKPKHATPNVYRQKHWSEEKSYTVLPARPARELGDNNAADPEQAGWHGKGE
jgi:hypothetical protein